MQIWGGVKGSCSGMVGGVSLGGVLGSLEGLRTGGALRGGGPLEDERELGRGVGVSGGCRYGKPFGVQVLGDPGERLSWEVADMGTSGVRGALGGILCPPPRCRCWGNPSDCPSSLPPPG